MAQKVTYWLLITLVLTLGFGQLLRFELAGIPLYFHDLLVVFILMFQLPTIFKQSLPPGIKLFGLGLTLGWVTAFFAYPPSSLLIPGLYSLRLVAYLLFYLTLTKAKFRLPSQIFFLSGLITLVIGLLQYLLIPDMRVFQYLGWDDHLNRLTLPHFDPTFTAVMLSLAMFSFVPTRSTLLYPVFSLLAILLTYSRSVWLSLVLTGALFIKNKKLLLVASILILVTIFVLPRKFGEGTNLLRTYSISSRYESDLSYAKQYKWDLLIGRGMNTLILDSGVSKYINHATGPNNSYLYLLLTTGIIGLIGWGKFMYSLYQKSLHKPMLIFFFIASLFNNVMFYPFSLLWILLIPFMAPTST